ncbi:MAG: glycerophosphodiester phosphodiesterase [Alphaproteobacteria bacterium]
MNDGIALAADDGRRVLLKWHKLRRAAHEPPFDPTNLRAGLAAGASLEVDVRRLADDAWVCLHDDVLDEETDGAGPVTALASPEVAGIRIRGAAYPPPLLAELVEIIVAAAPSSAILQLDLKEPAATLTERAVAGFAAAVAPVAGRCLLSGCAWPAVARLGAAVPGLRLGYDPYEDAEGRTLATATDMESLAWETLETAPDAAIFYLYHRFVAAALDLGVNPLAILKCRGALVDIWTLDPSTPGIEAILPRMIAAGADQITTNAPVALQALWDARSA